MDKGNIPQNVAMMRDAAIVVTVLGLLFAFAGRRRIFGQYCKEWSMNHAKAFLTVAILSLAAFIIAYLKGDATLSIAYLAIASVMFPSALAFIGDRNE